MDFFITRLNIETFAMLNHLTEPRFFVKTIIIGEYDAWKICLSKEELMNIFKAYALINMQNYTKRVIEIIYGTPENLTAQ